MHIVDEQGSVHTISEERRPAFAQVMSFKPTQLDTSDH